MAHLSCYGCFCYPTNLAESERGTWEGREVDDLTLWCFPVRSKDGRKMSEGSGMHWTRRLSAKHQNIPLPLRLSERIGRNIMWTRYVINQERNCNAMPVRRLLFLTEFCRGYSRVVELEGSRGRHCWDWERTQLGKNTFKPICQGHTGIHSVLSMLLQHWAFHIHNNNNYYHHHHTKVHVRCVKVWNLILIFKMRRKGVLVWICFVTIIIIYYYYRYCVCMVSVLRICRSGRVRARHS